jgi:hypothetical protein
MLDTTQLAARDGKLTASRIRCLMTGTPHEIMDLWRELIGDPTYTPKDLSGAWPVQLGYATEQLNCDWYERKEGRTVSRRGEVVIHPKADWAACTLDGWDATVPCPIEAKHVGGREARSTVIDRYVPQCTWQCLCTGAEQVILSIIEGANEPVLEVVPLDKDYAAELWRRAERFMECVWNLHPPVTLPPVAPPVQAKRELDMRGSNEWAVQATHWLDNIEGKRKAEAAEKALKALVPDDVARAYGHKVQVTRNKIGHLALRELA